MILRPSSQRKSTVDSLIGPSALLVLLIETTNIDEEFD